MKRLPLITSFALFIALCASAAYWAMQFLKPPQRAVATPPPANQPALRLEAATGLLGGHTPAVATSHFQLKGVVVASKPSESVAILAADGKPTKTVRTNAEVAPGVTVKEVNRRYVLLSENGVIKRVELLEVAKSQMNVANATGAGSPVLSSSRSYGGTPSQQHPATPSPPPQR